MSDSKISVWGARVHNLKNVDVTIPRNRLTVITGLSGSGKSSLAFDTIFAEGQRRYIETFSAYARNFLGNLQRPDVDKITGLSPVISIEQKTTNKNPRSTVGTTTEIYDFFRLLYARASEAFSYETGEKMVRYTEEQIIELILKDYLGRKICILSPLVKNRKGHYQDLFENIQKKGYLYVRVDGQIQEIIPGMKLDRYKNHDIEVVIDRLKVQDKDDKRLIQSVATAMKQGEGLMLVYDMETEKVRYYSKQLMCPTTGISYREPAPHDFSFNSPQGACPRCKGLGYVSVIDEAKVFPDKSLSLRISADVANTTNDYFASYDGLGKYISQMQDAEMSASAQKWAEQFSCTAECPECHGQRLNRESLHFLIAGKNIAELCKMDLRELYDWISNLEDKLSPQQQKIAAEILKEIRSRLHFLLDVGLDYLSLGRSSVSLSGGESQRIRLATQIGSQLVNVLYILDEPSIGLHQKDNVKLIDSLKKLRDTGNSVIVVEHDQEPLPVSI